MSTSECKLTSRLKYNVKSYLLHDLTWTLNSHVNSERLLWHKVMPNLTACCTVFIRLDLPRLVPHDSPTALIFTYSSYCFSKMSWTRKKTIGPAPPQPSFTPKFPELHEEKRASNNGRGTDDALTVTRILEAADIPCCIVGTCALIFYGAARVRHVCFSVTQIWMISLTPNSTGKSVSRHISLIKR